MLKLVIADDERVIRETLSNLVDWKSMGVELIGVCKDGIEAYNMILDESPDIVLTDIRMPGMTGLDLIREISQTDKQIQFIFLSGYEEFEYAREAMKYGARHYLLKPCNEDKLEESISQASRDCISAKKEAEANMRNNEMLQLAHQDAIYHIITEGIAWEKTKDENLHNKLLTVMQQYGQYHEFERGPCFLYYVYFLEWHYLDAFLEWIEQYNQNQNLSSLVYGVYVKNTLMLISYENDYDQELNCFAGQEYSAIEIKKETHSDIVEVLDCVIKKVERYDTVYAIHNYKLLLFPNNRNVASVLNRIYEMFEAGETSFINKGVQELISMISHAESIDSLHMIGNRFCTQFASNLIHSPVEISDFLWMINRETDIEKLRAILLAHFRKICDDSEDSSLQAMEYGMLSRRVMKYVCEHLSDCDLTLKRIAEEYLYMNVDYVSRQFRKDTGKKFSHFLAEQRVQRAKELLVNGSNDKLEYIATQVGCGNNPQYFSQIFKKAEGIPPGKWVMQLKGK